jgi:hypothetical protein
MKRNIALLLAAIMILSLFTACTASQLPPSLNTYTVGGASTSTGVNTGAGGSIIRNDGPNDAKDEWIVAEEYVVIQLGMTLEEVQTIIGSEGTGKKQGPFMFYTWTGFGSLGNIAVMSFKDDILVNNDPQERNVTGPLPTLEEAEALLAARGDDLAGLIDDAQERAEDTAEELGLEAPEESAADDTAPEEDAG